MLSFLLILVLSTPLFASDDSYAGYEAIVAELKMDAEATPPPPLEPLDWDSVALHGSVGLAGSLVNVPGTRPATGLLKGFELGVGANTFSRQVRAELAFRNFAVDRVNSGLEASMRELEARMIFLPRLTDGWLMRMGLCLTRRSLDATGEDGAGLQSSTYYGLLLGAEAHVAGAVSVGPDLAYRDAVHYGEGRKSSLDASFRLNATF